MKIAVLSTIRDWPWGAPGACMGALVDTLAGEGHEVLWLVAPIDLKHPEVWRLADKGVRVAPLPDLAPNYVRLPTLRRRAHRALSGQPSLRRLLGDFAPGHVFVNEGGAWSALSDEELMGCLGERPGSYSLIVHLNRPHPSFSPERMTQARALVGNARRMFFNSQWVRTLSEAQICAAIPQAGYFQLPLRVRASAALPWTESPVPRLAMVNRLDAHHKGIDLALGAVARFKREGVALHLSLYGEGPDRGYLEALIGFLDVADCVEMHGHREDIGKIWRDEELLLLPSRYEGLGVSMLEAMSFGRPVLRTPHGGAAEWIEDGVNGYLCPAAEETLLYESVKRALADRPNWRERGLRAFEKVRRDLDTDPARAFLSALRD